MTIKIHPDVGQILICDFSGFSQPEITKRRPVINLTPRRRVGTICTVVPLSTTAPEPVQAWNARLRVNLPKPYDNPECWIKGDMLYTVSFSRLDLFYTGKVNGKRQYVYPFVSPEEMKLVWKCVMYGLGRADVLKAPSPGEKSQVLIEERIVRKTTVLCGNTTNPLDFDDPPF